MAALMLWFRAPAASERRIHGEMVRRLSGARSWLLILCNSVLSTVMLCSLTLGLESRLVHGGPASWSRIALEVVAILVAYDFAYYFMHRYAFHKWEAFRPVHAVHHRVRFPTALDSLYMHPIENFAGLGMFGLCTLLIGPVHPYAYLLAFFVYSHLNIAIHAGLELPFPFRFLGAMARKHDRHHKSMKAGNYASISPLPDLIFGTRR